MTPFQRFVRLLRIFSKEMTFLAIYAVIAGLISLTLPLGTQAIIGFVSGGMVNSSWYILVGLVGVGVAVAGTLKLLQLKLAETIKKRTFAYSSIEFTLRILKFETEALRGTYTPELVNRFFDTLTIQKFLPKLLMEYAAAALTTFFGLLLLSLYHPIFIFLGMVIVLGVWLIFRAFASTGLQTSIAESKVKYRLVHWLEELGRALPAFKHYGASQLSMTKSDSLVNEYLGYRDKHFRTLFSQHTAFLVFKVVVTSGMLILGGLLVAEGDINLGQFVAAEIVVLQLIAALEKLVDSWEDLYDMLTSIEKIGEVYDLKMEVNTGLRLPPRREGLQIRLRGVGYAMEDANMGLLRDIDIDIPPSSRIGIVGYPSSGRTCLMRVLSRNYHGYAGLMEFDGQNVSQLELENTRMIIGDLLSRESLFSGTILENITMKPEVPEIGPLSELFRELGMEEAINRLPQGVLTPLLPGGRNVPKPLCARILLCRALYHQPRLVLLEDLLHDLNFSEKVGVMRFLCDRKNPWTVITIVDSCDIAAMMDRLLVMKEGRIIAQGTLDELRDNEDFKTLMRF